MKKQEQGFLLISAVIVLAIIGVILAIYYGKENHSDSPATTIKTGQKAIEETKVNNSTQLQEHMDVQNQINSIDN